MTLSISPLQKPPVSNHQPTIKSGSTSFIDVLKQKQEFPAIDMIKMIEKGKEVSPRDLLLCQVQMSKISIRVEVLSKVADGFLSTARKFQQNG